MEHTHTIGRLSEIVDLRSLGWHSTVIRGRLPQLVDLRDRRRQRTQTLEGLGFPSKQTVGGGWRIAKPVDSP